MDFGNPKKLKFLTICVLFRVLKRLEEEEGGGGGPIVTDFVTRVMRPKYLLKKSDRYISITTKRKKLDIKHYNAVSRNEASAFGGYVVSKFFSRQMLIWYSVVRVYIEQYLRIL